MTDSGWSLRLFGEPALDGPDGVLTLRTNRQLGVLLYGVLEGPRVRREQIVPLFWPEVAEKRGRHSLTQALSELRSALPGLVTSERGYLILRGLGTDLDGLSTHPERVERGDILEGLDGLGGVELAQWLDGVRHRIRTEGTRQLEDALRSADTPERRCQVARAILRLDPAHEQAAIVLAERDLNAGRTTDAVRQLKRHQAHVVAELGYDPQPRVAALLRRLERGDAARAREAILGDSLRLEATPEPIVGRDAEQAALAQAWDDVCAGRHRSLRFTGAAGMGKSLLLRNFMAGLAGQGHLAFMVTCHQATRAVPFALLADLFDALAAEPGFIASDPSWLAEASRVHPVLRTRFPGIPDPAAAPPESIRERLVEATTAILSTISEGGPIALAIDDADQGDQASLSVLGLVSRRVRKHSLLVLSATSDPEAGTTPPMPSDRHLHLAKLRDSALVTILQKQHPELADLDPVSALGRVARLADGNPHYALTLLADHDFARFSETSPLAFEDWSPPRNLIDGVSRAVSRHSPLARRVLAVLATAGRPATVDALARVSGLPTLDVRAALVELLAHERIRISGTVVDLSSPLWQVTIQHLEQPAIVRYLHEQWALHLLDGQYASDFERILEAAQHFLRAGVLSAARDNFIEGAFLARERGAADEAKQALERALHLSVPAPPAARLVYAELLNAEGRHAQAFNAASGLTSLDRARLTPREVARLEILEFECHHRGRTLSPQDLIRGLEPKISTWRELDGDVYFRGTQLWAELARIEGNREVLARAWQTVSLLLIPETQPERGRCLFVRGFLDYLHGRYHAARRAFERAYLDLIDLRLPHEAGRALNGAGLAAHALGDTTSALGFWQACLDLSQDIDSADLGLRGLSNLACLAEDSGNLELSLRLNEAALSAARSHPSIVRVGDTLLNHVDTLLLLGRIDEAESAREDALRFIQERGETRNIPHVIIRDVDIAFARGDTRAAARCLTRLWNGLESQPLDIAYRGRVTRQGLTLAAAQGRHLDRNPDPEEQRGYWTYYGRLEALVLHAWLQPEAGLAKARSLIAKGLGRGVATPLTWTSVTGALWDKPSEFTPGFREWQTLGTRLLGVAPDSLVPKADWSGVLQFASAFAH